MKPNLVILPEGIEEENTLNRSRIFFNFFSILVLIAVSGTFFIYFKDLLGTSNEHGSIPCAYDEEGFFSIAFMSFQSKNVDPDLIRSILFSNNKILGANSSIDHVFDRTSISPGNLNLQIERFCFHV